MLILIHCTDWAVRLRLPLTSRSGVVDLVGQIASLLVTSRVMLDLFNLLAHTVELRVDPPCSLVQLHQEIQRANLELGFVDLYEIKVRMSQKTSV